MRGQDSSDVFTICWTPTGNFILFTFSQSAVCLQFFNFFSPSVRYEAAGTLITLSTAPTAVKAAASCYIGKHNV